MPEAVVSPCINVCKMEAGFCIGCHRTLDEIAGWAAAGDDEKRLILAAVAQRRARLDPDAGLSCNCSD
ncbi:MAG: DUF1289 domain-containing protein [Sulfuritalea sp.]|nr:DUF1289 domain-containing protein [Sulfuritalea sp.]